jgi:hypothetical protein
MEGIAMEAMTPIMDMTETISTIEKPRFRGHRAEGWRSITVTERGLSSGW